MKDNKGHPRKISYYEIHYQVFFYRFYRIERVLLYHRSCKVSTDPNTAQLPCNYGTWCALEQYVGRYKIAGERLKSIARSRFSSPTETINTQHTTYNTRDQYSTQHQPTKHTAHRTPGRVADDRRRVSLSSRMSRSRFSSPSSSSSSSRLTAPSHGTLLRSSPAIFAPNLSTPPPPPPPPAAAAEQQTAGECQAQVEGNERVNLYHTRYQYAFID